MMVPRCGYYSDNGVLVRKTVWIDWTKGFDRDAKHAYCRELIDKLSYIGPVAEVTSASPLWETRCLSPIFVKMFNSDLTVEEYLQETQKRCTQLFEIKGLADLILLQNLGQKELRTIHKYKVYADVFGNPNKGFGNSQACSYGIYRVLEDLNKLDLLKDNPAFMNWYNNEMEIRIEM